MGRKLKGRLSELLVLVKRKRIKEYLGIALKLISTLLYLRNTTNDIINNIIVILKATYTRAAATSS